jgi:hypothetical protein
MSTSEKRKKSDRITLRIAPEQLEILRTRSTDVGLSISGYMLASALSQPVSSKSEAHLVYELRRLGIQQKELCIAYGGAFTPEYRAVLVEILAAIDRVGG